jgi:hypothetical protein
MSLAGHPMAKKVNPQARDDWNRKPLALQIRGSLEWKRWVEKAAEFNRSTVANFVDQAIARAARESGFTEPPPRR